MAKTFLLVIGLGFISMLLLIFVIYWFELDDKFLKAFEPTFRKMSDWVKSKG